MALAIFLPKSASETEMPTIVAWRKQKGDAVTKDEILLEIETDKVVMEIPAPVSGVLLEILVTQGSARADQPVGWIGEPEEEVLGISITARSSTPTLIASPAARRRARELNIDLAQVRGTGPDGRITEADVENAGRAS